MSSDLTILTATDVDNIILAIDPELALSSQLLVFQSYSDHAMQDAGEMPKIQAPQRLRIRSTKSTTLFMPARVEGLTTACKLVAIPTQGGDGLPATTLMLDDEGRVRGVVNARKLTALRNACGSSLFLRSVSFPKPPAQLLVFGSGAQAHSHAAMFIRIFPSIRTVTFAVRSANARAISLVDILTGAITEVAFKLQVTFDPSGGKVNLWDVVGAADIILTATSSKEALFPSNAVKAGTRLVLIGSYNSNMREVDDALIKRAGLVVVDSKEACGHEAGELISAGMRAEDLVELGEVLRDREAQKAAGTGGDILVCKSVGLGVRDVAITKLVFDVALQKGWGQTIIGYDD